MKVPISHDCVIECPESVFELFLKGRFTDFLTVFADMLTADQLAQIEKYNQKFHK